MRFLVATLAILMSACGGSSGSSNSGMSTCPAGTTVVTVAPGSYGGSPSFSPAAVTITAGQTVCWQWANSGHSVTSGSGGVADGKFCSPADTNCAAGATSPAGTVYTHQFTSTGPFPYFCSVHWSMGMTGTVTAN